MIKKTVTYTNYFDNQVTEDIYFNISKAELLELEATEKGGFGQLLKDIGASDDPKQIIEMFKRIIMISYGVRSPDGKRFVKSPDLAKEFEQSAAYEEFLMNLLQDPQGAADWAKGMMPSEADMEKMLNGEKTPPRPQPQDRLQEKQPTKEIETSTPEHEEFLEWKKNRDAAESGS